MNDTLLTLRDVAEMLKISESYAAHVYPRWSKWGVVPRPLNGKGKLLFWKNDVIKMVNNWGGENETFHTN